MLSLQTFPRNPELLVPCSLNSLRRRESLQDKLHTAEPRKEGGSVVIETKALRRNSAFWSEVGSQA